MTAENQLRKTISLLNAIIESTADGLLIVDRQGKIVKFNQTFVQMWRIPQSVLATQDDNRALEWVLSQLNEPEAFLSKVKALYMNPELESFDILHFKDGRTFERFSRPQRLGSEIIGRVWSFRDVTEHRRIEDERSRLIRDLENAIALRENFLSIASHELKTPLTSLTMQIQLLNRLLKQGKLASLSKEDTAELFGITEQQIARFTTLINDLLDTSRISAGRLELELAEVRLLELIENICKRFRTDLEKSGCSLKKDIDSEIKGTWDAHRIEQLLVNLLSNAMKYGAGKPIQIRAELRGDRARITVRDEGIGIAKEDQDRIFNRFERAASLKRFGGLGLGLYICRQIVEAHQGTISVESEPGKGSLFIVELPLRSSPSRP